MIGPEHTALELGMATNIRFNLTLAIAAATDCKATDEYSTSPALIECLRSLSVEIRLGLSPSSSKHPHTMTVTSSSHRGPRLPERASEFVATGKFPKIANRDSWMENDATLFTNSAITTPNDTRAFFELYYPYLNLTTI